MEANNKMMNFINLFSKKRVFLLQVFTQLGITYGVSKSGLKNNNTWTLFAFQICIILILAFIKMPAIVKFVLFCAFSISFGIQLSK